MRLRVLLIALSVSCTTWAVAQDDARKTDTEEKTSESKAKQSDQGTDTVYTKDHLRKQVNESAKSDSVIYNENLAEESADRGGSSAIVFTNDTLTTRYGRPAPAPEPPTTQPSPDTAPAGDAAADPDAEADTEPTMSPEERTGRIAWIEAEIGRLEKRTLAIKNPFSARSPPSDEERTNEDGMTAPEKVQSVESEIAKLKAELQELQ